MIWPLTILHLSDLHFGPHGRFAGEDKNALAGRFHQAIEQAREELGWKEPVGLCIVTGDVAEAARPGEYEEARTFLEALIGRLGLARPRVIFAPGNHDISWHVTRRIELDRDEQGFSQAELERRIREEKFRNFDQFLARFYDTARTKLAGVQELGHGAFVHSFPEERMAVAVLNSCERESHLQQGGALSQEQAQALMSQWQQGEAAHWIKLVALHHNPVATVPMNVKSWVTYLEAQAGKLKPETIRHFAADAVGLEGGEHLRAVAEDCHVQLVLHGHHHAAAKEAWHWTKATGHTLVLSAGSWGLRPDKLPADQPNMMHLVRIDPASEKVQSVLRIFDPRARAEGHVQSGHFTVDPANAQGAPLRLSVPEGFRRRQAAPNPISMEAGKVQDFIQEYRTRLKKRFERWDLRGVGAVQAGGAGKPIEATLDDMYLPLRLAEGFEPERVDAGRVEEPSTLIARQEPLVVRGSAGSGKTTWMRWTFRRLVEMPGAIPFMIELRRLAYVWASTEARGAGRTLDAYLRDVVAESGASGWEEALPQLFKSEIGPRPILLVDGWDELGELGEELRDKLIGFLEAHPRVLAVVSSRPYGSSRPSRSDGFEVLDLQPLSDEEIAEFTHQFHRRVYGEDAAPARESAQHFRRALRGSPEATSLARIPLLLTMMLLISRDRPLPDKRHLLYEECIRNLLSARPEQRELEGARLQQDQWRPADSAERWRALAAMAFQMQMTGYKTKRGQIVGTSRELGAVLPEGWKREERTGFLAWLVGAAGVMIDRADGTLSFAHLSFQEYLAAHHLAVAAEGEEARFKLCQERMEDLRWWETLRLWAAIVADRNPAHLSPVLRRLTHSGPAGFWLAGAVLADGPGGDVFAQWCEKLGSRFHIGEREWSDVSADAWSLSRQADRRSGIAQIWHEVRPQWSWLSSVLAHDWVHRSGMAVFGESALSEVIGQVQKGQGVGRTKVFWGSSPMWPTECMDLVFLRLFPTPRVSVSARLQSLLSLKGKRKEFLRAARFVLAGLNDESSREQAQLVASRWAQELVRELSEDFKEGYTRYWEQGWARRFARDVARDFANYWALNLKTHARGLLVQGGLLVGNNEWVFVRHMARFWASDRTRYWAPSLKEDLARSWARYFARNVPKELLWMWEADVIENADEWKAIEVASTGRAWTRAMVAHFVNAREPSHLLLQAACSVSLDPNSSRASLDKALSAYPGENDPLWPALARHLARCSNDEDRALLIDLAQHPEKREEPLASGLKYYVRGDLVFEDGGEMTLDALCDELGLPRLPYLEEMPPEIDVA